MASLCAFVTMYLIIPALVSRHSIRGRWRQGAAYSLDRTAVGAEAEDKRAAARSLPGSVKLWLSIGSVGLSIAADLQVLRLKISGLAQERGGRIT